MQPTDPQRPVSPELRNLQQPGQDSTRRILRRAGLITLGIGLLCLIVSLAEFFFRVGSMEEPRFFWLAFIGMPLIFVGGLMCQFGFMGAIARFTAGEVAPVATDTARFVAEETKGAVETVSKAAAKGVVEGMDEALSQRREGKD